MTKFTDEGIRRFSNKLRRLGVDDKLKEMGITNGDMIEIEGYQLDYTE